MTTILEQYNSNVVFDTDFRKGSIKDQSSYAAPATVTAPVQWVNTKNGYGVRMVDIGYISYADNAANRLNGSEATFIFFGNFSETQISSRLICKRNAGATSYDISCGILASQKRWAIWDGSSTAILNVSSFGGSMIVFTLINGQKAKIYIDGTYVSEANVTTTIPSSSAPLIIGNYYNTASKTPLNSPLCRTVLLNRALSSEEIAQLHLELKDQKFPLRAYSFGKRLSAIEDPPGCPSLLKTDFTTKLPDGRLCDLSGNGWHGTIKPGFIAGPGMFGNSLEAKSATIPYIDFGNVSTLNNAPQLTFISYNMQIVSSGLNIMCNKGTSLSNRADIVQEPGYLAFYVKDKVGVCFETHKQSKKFIAWIFDGTKPSDKMDLYVDGTKKVLDTNNSNSSTFTDGGTTSFEIGRLAYLNNYYTPTNFEFFAIYPYALTEAQVNYIYKQIARQNTFSLDLNKVPVSLANLVGPCDVPNTPFRVQDGTWKVGEDSLGKHWINSVVTNNKHVYMVSKQVYGTWVCSVYHTTGDEYFAFITNCKDLSLATRNVYSILITGTTLSLYRFGPSSSTVLMSSTSCVETGKTYKLAISRNSSGQFTVYIKGEAYVTWTIVTATSGTNPVIDTTYVSSSNCVLSTSPAASGGGFADFDFFQGVLTIDNLNELGL